MKPKRKPQRTYKSFFYLYRGGRVKASVVAPPDGVPDVDTIRLDFVGQRKPYGIYLTPDEALAAASVLTDAVWHEGKRAKRWPRR